MPLPQILVSVDAAIYQALSASIEEEWGEPCDRFTFDIALNGKPFSLPPRGKVQILFDGKPAMTGWLEGWTIENGIAHCKGRNILGPIVDSGVPPNFKLNDDEPCLNAFTQLFALKGLTYETAIADLAKPLKKVECKPPTTIMEVVDHFAKRNALVVRARPDGSTIDLLRPDFASSTVAHYAIAPNSSNVLGVSYQFDLTNQPSIILSQGVIGGGNEERSYPKAAMINELTGYSGDALSKPGWAGATIIPARSGLAAFARYFENKGPQTEVWIKDEGSRTGVQLETALKRKMASYTERALTVNLRIMGIGPQLNTMVSVNDSWNAFFGNLWVCGRSVSAKGEGTITNLTLQLPFSAEL